MIDASFAHSFSLLQLVLNSKATWSEIDSDDGGFHIFIFPTHYSFDKFLLDLIECSNVQYADFR